MNELLQHFRTLFLASVLTVVVLSGLLLSELVMLKTEKNMLSTMREQYQQQCKFLQQKLEQQETFVCTVCKQEQIVETDEDQEEDEGGQEPFASLNIVLNRDPSYLRESALSFAKMHDLEARMKALFESPEVPSFNKKQIKARRKQQPQKINLPLAINKISKLQRTQVQMMLPSTFEWPVKPGAFWLSSPFGSRKKSNGTPGFHYGIDLAAPKGTLVHAATDGNVESVAYDKNGYGKTILIAHNNRCKTRYAHLQSISVVAGQAVKKNECIGRVGDTGYVRGRKDPSHLHFELIIDGKKVNPLYALI